MNKTTTKWLSSTVVALALAGGSVALAMPAQAASVASQTVATHNDGRDHDRRDHDRRDHDRHNDWRTERICNFLDRYFDDDDNRHNHHNDRWDNDTFRALERWYDRHCDD